MASLTAANAIIALSIPLVYPAPQQLSGFAAEDIFSTEAIDSAEVSMGVDGKLSAGFVFVPIKQNYVLQADSASNSVFDNWWGASQAAKDVYFANAVITLISIGQKYAMTNGILSSYAPSPDIGKILKPRRFTITWESLQRSPV